MSTSEKTIDEQLSSIPFREKQNSVEYERLLRALQDGEVKAVTLEKTFVPAYEINRYVVVEHLVGQPASERRIHTHNELSGHVLYSEAMRTFQEKLYYNQGDVQSNSELRELLLVGKYGSGQLAYDKDGELDKTTGITLDYALTFPGRSYDFTSSRDPFLPVTVQEKLFAMVDTKTQTVQLYDSGVNIVTLNDFWIQKEGPTLNGVKIPPKSIEDFELLSKNAMSNGNGIKR